FGPSIEALMEMLKQRKRKILETYETEQVQNEARNTFQRQAENSRPPNKLAKVFHEAVRDEQIRDLEDLWYRTGDERGEFARQILQVVERLGEKYQIDELAGKYEFTGQQSMSVPQA